MMKKKNILGKSISLLLVCSMLLSITGTNTKVLASENTETQTQTSDLPWAEYKRITMADYGANIASSNEGTTFSGSQSWTYKGDSLDGTYLDVDINFNGNFNNNYFQFFTEDWYHYVRFQGNDYSDNSSDALNIHKGGITWSQSNYWLKNKDTGIRVNEFFNLKILVDINANAENTAEGEAQNDVTFQVYINDKHVATETWTAVATETYKRFYFYVPSGVEFSLRTPEAWTCYQQITMSNFGIEASTDEAGTEYTASAEGKYTGISLNKTYLDVDIKYGQELTGSHYIHFFATGTWKNYIRFQMTGTENFYFANLSGEYGVSNVKEDRANYGLKADEFFNLKILVDIVTSRTASEKKDVILTYYINNKYVGTMSWTEEGDVNHDVFYLYMNPNQNTPIYLRTPTPEPQSYFKLSDYRETTPYTYPTRSGYVFAGWYTDAEYTTPVEADATSGQAYAKFVQSEVLTVKCQLPIDANRTEPTTSLRLVTSVDTLNYQYVGFELEYTLEDKTYEKTFKTKNVKKTIKATGDDGKEITYYPNEFSTASTYMMALKINKIPSEIYELPLTITPYWITLDGTVVTGTTRNDVVLYPEIMEGGSTFANDNEAYYRSAWN